MEDMLSLIPVKLFFILSTFYIWKYLLQRGKTLQQPLISRWALGFAVLSIVLSVISLGKIYPYGATTDLLAFAVMCSIVMALPTQKVFGRALSVMLFSLLLLGPLVYISHYLIVGGPINKDSFISVFQTTNSETFEYLASFTSVASILPIIIFLGLAVWVIKRDSTEERQPLKAKSALFISTFSLFLIVISPIEKGLFTYPVNSFISYKKDIDTIQKRLKEFSERQTASYEAVKREKGEVYIVVIGESLNKHHMGLYGYEKETTPKLSQLEANDEVLVVKNSFSNYPRTVPALSYALTQANQKNNKIALNSIGLLNVMNQAQFNTYWIGNQPLSTSYDMSLGLIAKEAKHVELAFDAKFTSTRKGEQKPDEILLPLIDKALNEVDSDENTIIFVHLSGNHTDYCNRYPAEYKKYEVSAMDSLWMHLFKGGPGRSKECYDNSIIYNDFVVSSIIKKLKAVLTEEKVGGLIYFADHADDVTRGGHSSANFSYDMIESPMMTWFSPAYRGQRPLETATYISNMGKYYPNDFIFDTVIGMTRTEVSQNVYCSTCDLFSAEYVLPLEEAKTMHGKLPYYPVKPKL